MPWRGARARGEFPTLGYLVADWIEAYCVVPDGPRQGEPFLLTDEMVRFLLHWYRLREDARPGKSSFVRRRALVVRPQKWGKGPFAASIIAAEAAPDGVTLFDGWDAYGEPVGRPWETPWWQVTAASEDQTANIWRALRPMIELGPLGEVITDTGETRINLPDGGLIERVTFSALSRLGQRITGSMQDETHGWTKENGGTKVADNQRRNLAGMGGRAIEWSNAWDPAEHSVAQQTAEAASKLDDVLVDYPTPARGSFRNRRERRSILRNAYGDSELDAVSSNGVEGWVDLDRIEGECVDLITAGDMAQAERYFGNRIVSAADAAFDPDLWAALGAPGLVIPQGRRELITIGFDGAKFEDSTALVATHVELGFEWPLGIWEKPEGDDDWEVPSEEVTEVLEMAFDTWEVWRLYGDPPYWEDMMSVWAGKFGATRIVRWWTNRSRAMAWAIRGFVTGQTSRTLSHNGDPTLAAHVEHARRRPHTMIRDEKGRPMWTITKDRPASPLKIDGAMAAVLAWEARSDCIASGALEKRKGRGGGGF